MTEEIYDDSMEKNMEIDSPTDIFEKAKFYLEQYRVPLTLVIERVKPSWCSGFLEEFEVDPENPIDLQHIIDTWGGTKIRIRLRDPNGRYVSQGIVNLSSYPPRHWGEIKVNNHGMPEKKSDIMPQLQNPTQDMVGVLKIVQQQRDRDMERIEKMFEAQMKMIQTQQQNRPASTLDELLHYATGIKKLQGLFGSEPASVSSAIVKSEEPTEMAMLSKITDIIGAFRGQRTNPTGSITPPKKPAPMSIIDHLSGLDVNDLSNLMLTTLQHMPEDKRSDVIETFLEQAGIDFADDSEDDDSDDIESEGSRGTVPTDEEDNPSDRESD